MQFLKVLSEVIGTKLLIIRNRLQAHKYKLVRAFIEQLKGCIALEHLPAYAPELNSVKCIWGYLKYREMPNFCTKDLGHLKHAARSRLRSIQRRTALVGAFWKQAQLF